MNIHIIHLPVLRSLASQIRMCVPLFLYFPILLLGTRSLEIESLGTALEVLKGLEVLEVLKVDILEDNTIFDLKGRAAER